MTVRVDVFAAMRTALVLLDQGRFAEAETRCRAALGENPNYVPLRLALCEALLGLHRDADAEENLRHCLKLDPMCGVAYRHLAELALRRDHPKAAARLLEKACRFAPGDGKARQLLAGLEERLRRAAGELVRLPAAGPSPGEDTSRFTRPGAAASPRRRRAPSARGSRDAARHKLARGTDSPGASRPSHGGEPAYRGGSLRDGFGDYLAAIGLVSRAQVRAALIYRRTRGGQLKDAIMALGFVSEPKLRWAEQAYQASGSGDVA